MPTKAGSARMLAQIPQGRFGQLDDLVGAAIFLASDAVGAMSPANASPSMAARSPRSDPKPHMTDPPWPTASASTASPTLDAAARAGLLKRAEADLDGFLDTGAADHRGGAGPKATWRSPRFAREFDKADVDRRRASPRRRPISTPPSPRSSPRSARRSSSRSATSAVPRGPEARGDVDEGDPPRRLRRRPLRPIPSVACYVPRGKGSFPSVGDDDDDPGGRRRRAGASRSSRRRARTARSTPRRSSRRGSPASTRSTNAAAPRPSPPSPMARETVGRYAKIVGPGSPFVVGGQAPPCPMSSTPACRPGRAKRSSLPTTPSMGASPRSIS